MHVLSLSSSFQFPQNSLNQISRDRCLFKTAEDGPLKEEERVMIIYPLKVLQKFVQASWPSMAVNLSKNGPALTDAYNEVVNERTGTDW